MPSLAATIVRLLPANPIYVYVAVAALAYAPAAVEAHLPSPWTRTVKSANGQYILVVLMPVRDRVERREVTDYDPQIDQNLTPEELQDWDELVRREKAIEAKYSESGVYRAMTARRSHCGLFPIFRRVETYLSRTTESMWSRRRAWAARAGTTTSISWSSMNQEERSQDTRPAWID